MPTEPTPEPTALPEDPAVVTYKRLRRFVTLFEGSAGTSKEREEAGNAMRALEQTLIATPATTPLGVAVKLRELAEHQGWDPEQTYYESRLCLSALDDLERMGPVEQKPSFKDMEDPIYLLLAAVWLLEDFAKGARNDIALRPDGLVFYSEAMVREVEKLYLLFHGSPPAKVGRLYLDQGRTIPSHRFPETNAANEAP